MYALTKTTNLDPEALLYDAFGTLSIVGKILTTPTELAYLEAHPVHAAIVIAAAQAAIPNFELGLTETPGEARSLHGAFHVFEAHFAEQLTQAIASFGAPSAVESLNSIPRAADTSHQSARSWNGAFHINSPPLTSRHVFEPHFAQQRMPRSGQRAKRGGALRFAALILAFKARRSGPELPSTNLQCLTLRNG
jgi:hypothetical protein